MDAQRRETRDDATLDEVGTPIDNAGFGGRPLRSKGGALPGRQSRDALLACQVPPALWNDVSPGKWFLYGENLASRKPGAGTEIAVVRDLTAV